MCEDTTLRAACSAALEGATAEMGSFHTKDFEAGVLALAQVEKKIEEISDDYLIAVGESPMSQAPLRRVLFTPLDRGSTSGGQNSGGRATPHHDRKVRETSN